MLRARVWEVLSGESHDTTSRWVGGTLVTLITLNVLAVMIETVEELSEGYQQAFETFELASLVIFSLEYLARLWSCVEDPRYRVPLVGRARFAATPLMLLDFLAIAPTALGLVAAFDLRFTRIFRLLRVFRLAKAFHYLESLQLIGRVLRNKRVEITLTSSLMVLMLVMASSLLYFAECEAQPEAFDSIPATMWWAVSALTTVGYGDVVPITPLGRLLGALVSILGIAFFALPTSILGSGFVEEIRRVELPSHCPHCGGALTPAGDEKPQEG